AQDGLAVCEICQLIGDSAVLVGAIQLARLVETLRQLADNSLLDQGAGFVAEIVDEFHRVFRQLLGIHTSYS
ncbi:MAG: hypothetical protein AAGC55_24810, partial [Myxococcota bacterium]